MQKFIERQKIQTKDFFYAENNFWLFLSVGFFTLPFGINFSVIVFIIAGLNGAIAIYKNYSFNNLTNFHLLFYPLYFSILIFTLIYTEDLKEGMKLVLRSSALVFFPIIFLFIHSDYFKVKRIFQFLSIGLLITFFINVFIAFKKSFFFNDEGIIIFDTSLARGYSFYESFSHGGNHFIGGEFSYFMHPSYLSLYIISTILFSISGRNFSKKIFFLIGVLSLYLFLLSARAAFLIIIISPLFFILKKKFRKKVILFLAFYIVGILFLIINPRILNIYDRLQDFVEKNNFNYVTSEQARLLTWKTSFTLILEAPVFGYGIGDAKEKLVKKFRTNNYKYNYDHKFNAHNQLLESFLQSGSIGALVLFTIFITTFMKLNYPIEFLLLFTIIIFMSFESMLVRYHGIIFFSIIMPLLSTKTMFYNSNK